MRECRGKRVDTGKWVYGYYVKHETRQKCPIGNDKLTTDEIKHFIVFDSFADWNMPRTLQAAEVVPETVGQYMGLKDKTGKEICQGDIVKTPDGNAFIIKFGEHRDSEIYDCIELGFFAYCTNENHRKMGIRKDVIFWINEEKAEVIGNIHDNPELLEVKNDI